MKRIIIILCALSILASAAFAAGGTETTAAQPKKVQLSIAWWGSQARHDRTIKVIELYMKNNPNVEITYEFAGWDDYWTKVTTMAAGGMLPDIMQQDYSRISDWNSKKLLAPLDEYVKKGAINLSDVEESAVSGGRIDGKLYGLNLGMNAQTIVLDVDAFKQAGIALPGDDWTWQDFDRISREINAKLGIWGTSEGLWSDQMWKNLYLANGEWAYSKDGKSIGYKDDAILVSHFKMIQGMIKDGVYPDRSTELAQFFGKSVEARGIVRKQSAMEYMWSNQVVAVAKASGAGRNFALAAMPRGTKSGLSSDYLKPSQFFSLTSHSKSPDEAVKFLDFFTNDIEANRILLGERGVPISTKGRAGIADLLEPASRIAADYVGRIAKQAQPIPAPDPAGHQEIMNNVFIAEVIDPVAFGKITPEAGAALLRKRSNEILASK